MRYFVRSLEAVAGTALAVASGIALAMPTLPAGEYLTAPATPYADIPTSMVVAYEATGADTDPANAPEVAVEGDVIHVNLNHECAEIFCDVVETYARRVELPALAAGEYTVEIIVDDGMEVPPLTFAHTVTETPTSLAVEPAEGYWSAQDRPGTGLFLERRGDLLTIGAFDFADGAARWSIDTVPYRFNAAASMLPYYTAGSCIGCEPYAQPDSAYSDEVIRLEFQSARRALATLGDGSTVAFVSMPYGAEYADVVLEDLPEVDETYGPLPLPDLRGTWVFVSQTDPPLSQVVELTDMQPVDEEGSSVKLRYDGTTGSGEPVTIVCFRQVPLDTAAGCTNFPDHDPFPPQIPGEGVWSVPLGNIEEDRFSGSVVEEVGNDRLNRPFHAYRLPNGE